MCCGLFLCQQGGSIYDRKKGFSYKPQYAVIVICSDEDDQKGIYNRLKEEGYKLKVVAV